MIELGEKVKDPITGFKGIATARTTWLYGCSRIAVQAGMTKDGKVPSLEWFDELQLKNAKSNRTKGGPPASGQETG